MDKIMREASETFAKRVQLQKREKILADILFFYTIKYIFILLSVLFLILSIHYIDSKNPINMWYFILAMIVIGLNSAFNMLKKDLTKKDLRSDFSFKEQNAIFKEHTRLLEQDNEVNLYVCVFYYKRFIKSGVDIEKYKESLYFKNYKDKFEALKQFSESEYDHYFYSKVCRCLLKYEKKLEDEGKSIYDNIPVLELKIS